MENNIDIPPFYIGEEVECINDIFPANGAENPPIKKGNKYKVTSIQKPCCRWVVTVGLSTRATNSICICGNRVKQGSEFFLSASRFRSINQKFETITYKAVLEQTQPMICVN